MTHRDRVGDPPGRRGAAGDVGHRQGLPTPQGSPLPVRPRDRNGGFPNSCGPGLSGSPMLVYGARGSRRPAPPRHALLAESPSPQELGEAVSMSQY